MYAAQVQRDTSVQDLLKKMNAVHHRIFAFYKETKPSDRTAEGALMRVAVQVKDCLVFIRDYCDDSFRTSVTHRRLAYI